ncbi:xanthine dehydrogenase family protein molybdopterin-binding subunit [Oceanicella sp. SM1341]|uniref:xanthine dehydrogenase family protein molybdopterin-binding subunit n=1 Tax=Oceanicella sp. SM1341 TaxID=1548889 RepID=UPI000E4D2559|nr:xanthine dehydrogenase family protein molybdopterin-binding subunit [Oceanicella sp. SM1341]
MTVHNPSRRRFLALGSGLVIGLSLPLAARAQSGAAAVIRGDAAGSFAPNAFVRIAPDDTVTVLIKHLEMGQGPYTGLTTLVAEELDADWAQMRAEAAPADAALYANTLFGIQGTGGSTAMANSYMQMRKAGAAARAMLVAAAAREWGVPEGEITVAKGVIAHEPSGNSSGFGALAEAARDSAMPEDPAVKDPSAFTLIGTSVPRLDSAGKSDGTARFSLDVYRDGMLTVAMLHPPKFGATLRSADTSAALAIDGVERVEELPSGLAVYARNTFAAFRGRAALSAEWDDSAAETRSTEQMVREWTEAARAPAKVAEAVGDVDAAFAAAATTHEAEYVFPYLAHAPMEPLDGVLELKEGGAELWMGSQMQTIDHQTVAGVLGLDPAAVTIHTMLAGGSFGRRAQASSQFASELATIAKAGGDGAYKLVWTRENDLRGGWYRPLTVHRLRGALDANGDITGWENTVANQSIIAGTPFEAMMEDGLDPTSYEGSTKMPYAWPASRVSWARMESKVPPLWWRSVGHTHTGYATETFLDELLEIGGKDPVEGRLALMTKDSAGRDRGVLERAADMAGWSGTSGGEGLRRGVAVHESFNTYVAMVAEVSERGGFPKVERVWCAVDCGVAVNPDVIRAQMEGGIGFGLGTAMFNAITLAEGGEVVQGNFDTYRMLRISEMPHVEVSIIESAEPPTGVGEPGVPPVAPAVGNAWRALTGDMPRRLPFEPLRGV